MQLSRITFPLSTICAPDKERERERAAESAINYAVCVLCALLHNANVAKTTGVSV